MSVRWVRPPSELEKAIEQYADRVLTAVTAVAEYSATTMQNEARRNARWTDRTGNARGGLFGLAVRDGKVIKIVLGHTMYYGLYLETSYGQKYAIIMTTIEAHLPELERMLRDLLSG
jgi:hypothetical protein